MLLPSRPSIALSQIFICLEATLSQSITGPPIRFREPYQRCHDCPDHDHPFFRRCSQFPTDPNLRLVVIMASGKARGITLCDCRSTNVDSVSKHAIGLYFTAWRKFADLHNTTVVVLEDMACDTEWKMKGGLNKWLRTSDGEAPLLCEMRPWA